MSTMRNRLMHLGVMMAVAFVLAAAWLNWTDRLAAQQAGRKPPEKATVSPGYIIPPGDLALMKALDSKLKFTVALQPMKDVLELLEQKTNGDLTIVIDSQGFKENLTDEPVFLNDPVSKDFKQPMKIRSILNMILGERPPGFGYYIEDGVLYITPAARANKKLVVRNYSVSDLIGGDRLVKTAVHELQAARPNVKGEILFGPNSQLLNQNIEGLMSLLKGNVDPDHWKNPDGSGGPGTMTFVPATAALQIQCSLEVHYLLSASGLLDNTPAAAAGLPLEKELQTVTVKVHSIAGLLDPKNLDRSQAELHKALNLIGVKSDKGGKASAATSITILSHAELLVARQPLAIHQRIESLLIDMRGLSIPESIRRLEGRPNAGTPNDSPPAPFLGQQQQQQQRPSNNGLSANLSGVTFGSGGGSLLGNPHSGPSVAVPGKNNFLGND